jgi:hypothetical protein
MNHDRCCGTCREGGDGECCPACLQAGGKPYWIGAKSPNIVGLLIAAVIVAIAAAAIAGVGALIGGFTA